MKSIARRQRFPLRASVLALVLAASTAVAQQQPREAGNFDPTTSAPATQPSTGPATRPAGRAARGAPRIISHSPRDDKAHWSNTDFTKANPALPSLIIAGDSTASTGDPDHRGWAAVLVDYFDTTKINIVNRAVGGRSFRTFYGEGKWKQIVDALKPGDFVVIEFGHNDGGGPTSSTDRGDVPGIGDETQEVTTTKGIKETVHSFGWYLRTFIRDAKQKSATPIVSSTTPRNIWTNGRVERGMGQMLDWAKQVATEEKVLFIDHSNITADALEKIGPQDSAKFFPADHTHTSTDGAILNAQTFISGLKAVPDMPLVNDLNDSAKTIEAYKPNSGN